MLNGPPATPTLILGDNLHTVTLFNEIASNKDHKCRQPSKHPSGTWAKAIHDLYRQMVNPHLIKCACNKAHMGFVGNEIVDAFAKWAAFAFGPANKLLPPPQTQSLELNGMPTISRLPCAHAKYLGSVPASDVSPRGEHHEDPGGRRNTFTPRTRNLSRRRHLEV